MALITSTHAHFVRECQQVRRAGASISRESIRKPSASSKSAHYPHSKTDCRDTRPTPTFKALHFISRFLTNHLHLSEQLIAEGRLIEQEDGLMICLTCGATKKGGLSIFIRHLETMHHFGNGYPCPFCEKMSWRADLRRKHVYQIHKKEMSTRELREMPPFKG